MFVISWWVCSFRLKREMSVGFIFILDFWTLHVVFCAFRSTLHGFYSLIILSGYHLKHGVSCTCIDIPSSINAADVCPTAHIPFPQTHASLCQGSGWLKCCQVHASLVTESPSSSSLENHFKSSFSVPPLPQKPI